MPLIRGIGVDTGQASKIEKPTVFLTSLLLHKQIFQKLAKEIFQEL